ncbi:hypothetical protein [Breznakibacter xylanolyticus]|nr:hypothetical protein [Marinilabiliaceae bacterium]
MFHPNARKFDYFFLCLWLLRVS